MFDPTLVKEVLAELVPILDTAVATINNPFLNLGWRIFKIFLTSQAGATAIHAAATAPKP